MPDFTMCKNNSCGTKDTCYRFTAKRNEYWQSYFLIEDEVEFAENCTHYWPDQDAIKKKDLQHIKLKDKNTNSTVDDRERRKDLNCSFCPPNKGENSKSRAKRGPKKPKYKNKRSK